MMKRMSSVISRPRRLRRKFGMGVAMDRKLGNEKGKSEVKLRTHGAFGCGAGGRSVRGEQ